jgi:hypothetical protein
VALLKRAEAGIPGQRAHLAAAQWDVRAPAERAGQKSVRLREEHGRGGWWRWQRISGIGGGGNGGGVPSQNDGSSDARVGHVVGGRSHSSHVSRPAPTTPRTLPSANTNNNAGPARTATTATTTTQIIIADAKQARGDHKVNQNHLLHRSMKSSQQPKEEG